MGPLARDLRTEASPWLKRRRCKWHRLPACGIRQNSGKSSMGPLARDLRTETSPWLKRRRCKWHRLPACGIRQIHRFRPSHECYRCIHLFAVVHGPGAHATAKNLFRKFTQAL